MSIPQIRRLHPGAARHRAIGNMTLDGSTLLVDGEGFSMAGVLVREGANWVSTSNLVIKDFDGPGIHYERVDRRASIMNNTIVDCDGGIFVEAVNADTESRVEANVRFWEPSFVENNLIYNCTEYGIKIGNGGEPGTAEVWNPEAGTEAFTGNTIVPVGHNMVVSPFGAPSLGSFSGDAWYIEYGSGSTRRYGERAYNCEDSGSPVFINAALGDYKLNPSIAGAAGNCSPDVPSGIGKGSPMRMDILPGTETSISPSIMRRSVGAFVVDDQAHYAAWSGGSQP